MSQDVDNELRQRIKRHYEQQTLPPDLLRTMQSIAFTTPPTPKRHATDSPPSNGRFIQFTAVMLLLLFGVLIGWQTVRSHIQTTQQVALMAAEIALNHQKQFELDFQTADVAQLDDTMSDLDFTLIYPTEMSSDDYAVLGARYCTIQSVIAAQIRLKDANQQEYTLYQFRAPDSKLPENTTVVVDGVEVTFWQEGELLLGLAHAAPQ